MPVHFSALPPDSPPTSRGSSPRWSVCAAACHGQARLFGAAEAFVWQPDRGSLPPVAKVNRVDHRAAARASTASATSCSTTPSGSPAGCPANNALLWGARGMGKSSLVKAVHADINARPAAEPNSRALKLIEIHREDIDSLPALMTLLRDAPFRFMRLLRRPLLRRGRHVLQVAEGRARRRHRGPARQCAVLRDLQPPPPAAARHDGERALDRDQSGRSGRGEGLAVRSVRAVARFPPLQPGRLSRHGVRLCRAFRPRDRPRQAAARRRSNGRRRAARVRAAPPGNTSRIWRAGSASRRAEPQVALLGQFTSRMPPATSATAIAKLGAISSPRTKWPAATPKIGVKKVKAESSPAR